jgi:hypothetical protein
VGQAPEPLPAEWSTGWASSGVRWGGGVVPIVDVGALIARLTTRRAEVAA